MRKLIVRSILVILLFLYAQYITMLLGWVYTNWTNLLPTHFILRALVLFLIRMLLPISIVVVYFKNKAGSVLGLNKYFFQGMGTALLFTLPLTVGIRTLYPFTETLLFTDIWWNAIHASFYEELLYRSLLFGLLFRFCGWGFIPASLIGAIFFGFGHIYQGNDIWSALGAFGITAIGAVWFAWLYIEWNYNAWLNIGMHFFMNLSWILYSVEGGAVGSSWANLFRLLTIASSVLFTLKLIRKKGKSQLNKSTIWTNKPVLINY